MVRVAPINLLYNPRALWFDPGDVDVRKGDAVVVETARGIELGHAAQDVIEVSKSAVKKLKTPLRPVKRIADDDDIAFADELFERGREALGVFRAEAAEVCPDMRPVAVEFLLDGEKATFYFESENRVDFRDLVHRLASRFHVRIDMRQIGVRDEARMIGGFGHCGQELCCKRFGDNFNPVSIRMAKTQDLSLNPQKISGLCGRLMCCLRYENDVYKDVKARAPKAGATVQTPDGPAKVVDIDVPREVVSVRIEDEKPVHVPLDAFEAPDQDARPDTIGEEGWEKAQTMSLHGDMEEPATFLTSELSGGDKLAEAGTVRHVGTKKRTGAPFGTTSTKESKSSRSRKKKSSGKGKDSQGSQEARRSEPYDGSASKSTSGKARRRRSTKLSSDNVETHTVEDQDTEGRTAGSAGKNGKAASGRSSRRKSAGRKGDNSSQGSAGGSKKRSGKANGESGQTQGRGQGQGFGDIQDQGRGQARTSGDTPAPGQGQSRSARRRRRRRRRAASSAQDGSQNEPVQNSVQDVPGQGSVQDVPRGSVQDVPQGEFSQGGSQNEPARDGSQDGSNQEGSSQASGGQE